MLKNNPKPTLYLSIDIEAFGPNPYINGLWSIGIAPSVSEIKGFEGFIKEGNWDEKTLNWFNQEDNRKAYRYNNLGSYNHGVTKEQLAENIRAYLKPLSEQYHLIFVAAPTAYDMAYLIKYFGELNPFPKVGWIDLYSFFYSVSFLMTGKQATNKNDYNKFRSIVSKEYAQDGIAHSALFDAQKQLKVFIALLEELKEIRSKFKYLATYII